MYVYLKATLKVAKERLIMKDKTYVCMFEEKDAFMYYHYFKTKKKANKFMKEQLKEYANDKDQYSLPILDARVCKVVKTYIEG